MISLSQARGLHRANSRRAGGPSPPGVSSFLIALACGPP